VVAWAENAGVHLWSTVGSGRVNVFAGLLQAAAVLLLLGEVEVGKVTIKLFTVLKLLLVVFMIVAGLSLFEHKNIDHWAPMGASGVFRGATSAFFGFLGYDEVCCLGGEAKNPQKDLPRAIFGTIACVTVLYVLASLALVGMVPFDQIDEESGFAMAFRDRDFSAARIIVTIGEIMTLPLVVVISFLAQPRLLYAMAEDGLLPSLFSEVNTRGNLFKGTLVSGAVCVARRDIIWQRARFTSANALTRILGPCAT
jgi:APA family basic amino acid/polyamine antiporter